jgi:hypothetical protein
MNANTLAITLPPLCDALFAFESEGSWLPVAVAVAIKEAHADLVAAGIVDVPAVVEDPKSISSPPGKKSLASVVFSPPTTLFPDTVPFEFEPSTNSRRNTSAWAGFHSGTRWPAPSKSR